MLTITLKIKDPHADIQAVKEALAYYCEQYGDLEIIDVREERTEKQMSIGGLITNGKQSVPARPADR